MVNRDQIVGMIYFVVDFAQSPQNYPNLTNPKQPLPEFVGNILALSQQVHEPFLRQHTSEISLDEFAAALIFFLNNVLFVSWADPYRTLGLNKNTANEKFKKNCGNLISLRENGIDYGEENWSKVVHAYNAFVELTNKSDITIESEETLESFKQTARADASDLTNGLSKQAEYIKPKIKQAAENFTKKSRKNTARTKIPLTTVTKHINFPPNFKKITAGLISVTIIWGGVSTLLTESQDNVMVAKDNNQNFTNRPVPQIDNSTLNSRKPKKLIQRENEYQMQIEQIKTQIHKIENLTDKQIQKNSFPKNDQYDYQTDSIEEQTTADNPISTASSAIPNSTAAGKEKRKFEKPIYKDSKILTTGEADPELASVSTANEPGDYVNSLANTSQKRTDGNQSNENKILAAQKSGEQNEETPKLEVTIIKPVANPILKASLNQNQSDSTTDSDTAVEKFGAPALLESKLETTLKNKNEFVVIVNKDNQQELSVQDIKNIYLNNIIAWENGEKIDLYNLPLDSSIRDMFSNRILYTTSRAAASEENSRRITNTLQNASKQKREVVVISQVARNSKAIGYVSKNAIKENRDLRIIYPR